MHPASHYSALHIVGKRRPPGCLDGLLWSRMTGGRQCSQSSHRPHYSALQSLDEAPKTLSELGVVESIEVEP
jgi:hypothetical protein